MTWNWEFKVESCVLVAFFLLSLAAWFHSLDLNFSHAWFVIIHLWASIESSAVFLLSQSDFDSSLLILDSPHNPSSSNSSQTLFSLIYPAHYILHMALKRINKELSDLGRVYPPLTIASSRWRCLIMNIY
jgi:hypothetical protein